MEDGIPKHRHPLKITGRILCGLLIALASVTAVTGATEAEQPAQALLETQRLEEQRQLYTRATRALAQGDRLAYSAIRKELHDYPLLPYLDYADISARIRSVGSDEVRDYLATYPTLPVAQRLRSRYLDHLASTHQWQDYRALYEPRSATTIQQCHYAHALFKQGDNARASELARDLWAEGRSRPAACDPLFAVLKQRGLIDNDLAWRRFTAALLNHQFNLANYAKSFLTSSASRERAEHFMAGDRNPSSLTATDTFREHSAEEARVIAHGLRHLADSDPQLALKLWNRYHQSHPFTEQAQVDIISALVKGLVNNGFEQSGDQYLHEMQGKLPTELLDWRLRGLVENRDWTAILRWSARLSPEHRDTSRWVYWRARALALTGGDSQEIKSLYSRIAGERSFYGFLASEWLGKAPQMQHEPVAVSAEELATLAAAAAFKRIRELYYHEDFAWARREWYSALSDADSGQWIVAAKLAERWQWHNQAIMSMIQAGYWNDIDTRFPIPYPQAFEREAKATGLPVNLLLALSRQESAFNPDVTSPAGARGLMQLMPATARETARRHNIRYRGVVDLVEPEKNILIGSRYYAEMLERFDNNRILATAAYNAGPGRVKRWRASTGGTLPFDAWIEAIPFRETRNYVQNVLAFSIIFAHHLEMDSTTLSDREKLTDL